jgi:predicted MFS family arabinose efflux permease
MDPTPAYPTPDLRRMYVIAVIAGVGLGMTAPITALYARALGASELMAGVAVSSSAVSLLAVDVFGSRFVPRVDGRFAMWGSLSFFGLGSLLSAAVPLYPVMVGARMFQGLGAALFMGAGLRLAVDGADPGAEGRAIGAFNASWFMGVALGPFLSGAVSSVGDHLTGLRLAFGACAVICAVAAVVCRLALPRLPSGRRPEIGLPALGHLGGRRAAGALSLAAVGQAVRAGLALTLVPLIGQQRGLATLGITVALGALALTDVSSMRVGGALGDRRGRHWVLAAALAWGAFWCVALMAVPAYGPFVIICLALGVTVGITWALPPAIVLDLCEKPEGGLMAYRISADVGMFAGSIGLGFVLGRAGSGSTLIGAALALVAAAGVALWVGETRRPPLTLVAGAVEPAGGPDDLTTTLEVTG